MRQLSPITLCGSISHHPGPLGARLHGAGYAALGLPFVYVPFRVDDLAGAVAGMRALGVRGLGVSMPFKVAVLPLLDRIDDLAARIGAVNTLVNDDGVVCGYNTDAAGAAAALAEVISVAGRRVVVLGTGGAARAIGFAMANATAHLHIAGRDLPRAQQLATALGASAGRLDDPRLLDAAEVLINCTPIGQLDHPGLPVPATSLRRDLVVFDAVYKPDETDLLRAARAAAAPVVAGTSMLLHQAFRQFELYTGRPAPRAAMRAALEGND